MACSLFDFRDKSRIWVLQKMFMCGALRGKEMFILMCERRYCWNGIDIVDSLLSNY